MKFDKSELEKKIREATNLDNEDKSNLLQLLREKKTYGLVWEDSTEKVWEQLKDYIPVLTEDKSKAIVNDTDEQKNPNHILIEGDNLLALTSLCFTHEGKIDVIYIDPPYNTGNKDFVYNDSFVDSEDSYRHSKWLSFINRRLKIAKKLLSDKGVIFISIDDNEQAPLKVLCDEVFGNQNFITVFPRLTTKSGKTPLTFMVSHEYALCYVKSDKSIFVGLPFIDNSYKYKDEFLEERGMYNLKQPLDCNSISYSQSLDYVIEYEGKSYYPGQDKGAFEERHKGHYTPKDWAWRWSKERFEFGLRNGWIVFKNGRIYTKGYLNADIGENASGYTIIYREKNRKRSTIDFIDNEYSNDIAKKQLAQINVGSKFDFPKPYNFVSDLIRTHFSKASTILDFFAGSGTTLHATMQLNAEDGGHRQCILVTNNENSICEEVTYERNKRVIRGYTTPKGKNVEGLNDNNLRYFKVGYIPREKDMTNIERFARQSVNLLCIKEDVYKEQTMLGNQEADGFRYFKDGDKQFLVILEPDMIEPIIEELSKMDYEGRMPVYVFTSGHYPYTEDFWQVSEKVDLYPYPTCVYGAYEKVMPKMEDKLLDLPDDVELSDEEANMTIEDLNKE